MGFSKGGEGAFWAAGGSVVVVGGSSMFACVGTVLGAGPT